MYVAMVSSVELSVHPALFPGSESPSVTRLEERTSMDPARNTTSMGKGREGPREARSAALNPPANRGEEKRDRRGVEEEGAVVSAEEEEEEEEVAAPPPLALGVGTREGAAA